MEPLLYQGVSNQGGGTYSARIVSSGHTTHLGTYKTPEDAARSYDVAALALFETSAVTNFPMEAYSFAEVAMAKRSLASGGGMSNAPFTHSGAQVPLTDSPVQQHRHPQGSLAAADAATPEAEPLASAPPTREQQQTVAPAVAPDSTPNKRRHIALSAGEHKFQSIELPNRGFAGGLGATATPAPLLQQQLLKRSNSSTSAPAAAASPTPHPGFSTLTDVQQQLQPRASPDLPTTTAAAGFTKDQLQQQRLASDTAEKTDLLNDNLPRSPADIGHGPAALTLRDQQQQQPVLTTDHQQQQQEEPDLLASLIRSAESKRFACVSPTAAAAGDGDADRAGRIPQQPSCTTVDLHLQRINSSSSMGSAGNAGIQAPHRPANRRKPSSSSFSKDEQQQQQQLAAAPALRRGSSRASAAAAAWGWAPAAAAAAVNLGSGAAGTSYRGIILRRNGRYDGRLTVLGVKLYLGVFEDPADAAAAYDLAALALYEHNAAINFPRSNYSAAAVAARRAELLSKLAKHQNIGGSQAGQQAREWAAAQLAQDQQQQQPQEGQQQQQQQPEQLWEQWEFAETSYRLPEGGTPVPGRTQAVGRARAAAVTAAAEAAARDSKRAPGGSSSSRQQGLVPAGATPKKPRLGAALAAAAAGDVPGHHGSSSRSRPWQQQRGYMSGSGISAAAAAGIDVDGLWGKYVAHSDVLDGLFSLIEAAASLSPAAYAGAAAAAAQELAASTAAAAVPGQHARAISAHPGNRSSQQRQQRQQSATPAGPLAMLLSCLSPRSAAAAGRLPAAADPMDLDDRDTLADALLAGSAAKTIKAETPVAGWAQTPSAQNPSLQDPRAQDPMNLEVCWGGKPGDVKPITADYSETVASLKQRSCKLLGLDADEVEIWDYFHGSKYASLEDKLGQTLQEARIFEGQGILLDIKAGPLIEDATPPAAAAAAAPITVPKAGATAAAAAVTMKANEPAQQYVFDNDPDAGTGLHALRNAASPAAAEVGACQASAAGAFSCEQQQQRSKSCTISRPVPLDGKSRPADVGQHTGSLTAAAAGTDRDGSMPGQHVVKCIPSPPAAAAAAAIQRAFSDTRQISPPAADAAAADCTKGKRILRSHSNSSSMGRGSRSSSTTPAPMEVAAAAAGAPGLDVAHCNGNSKQATQQSNQQDKRKGRNCNSRYSKSPPADPQAVAAATAAAVAATAKPAKRKASPSPAAAGSDDPAAAGAGSSSGTPPLSKAAGPGSVSHAQNPTGNMGVRSRKGRFEAFLATQPFRYLYLGQYDTVDAAVAARDAAMLALYGPSAAAVHGTAWISATAAADAAVEGSAAAAAVMDMAAKLMKKDNVAGVMKDNGMEHLMDLARDRQKQHKQHKEGCERRAAAAAEVRQHDEGETAHRGILL